MPAHSIQKVVVLPLIRSPRARLNPTNKQTNFFFFFISFPLHNIKNNGNSYSSKEYSRHCEEGVTVQIVGLDALLVVLQDDLDEGAVFELHNVGSQGDSGSKVGWGLIGNGVVLEELIADAEVLSQLQGGFGINVRDTVDGVAELAVIPADGVNELEGASDVDLAVVVGALGVGPGGAGGQVPAEGTELVERPGPAHGSLGDFGGGRALAVGVADDALAGEDGFGEACGGDEVVVFGLLVSGDEDAEALAKVDVERVVAVLHGVGAFHLNEFHLVVLEAEVDGVFQTHVAETVLVGLAGEHREEGLISAVALGVLAVDEEGLGAAQGAAAVEELGEGGVALGVPVTSQHGVVVLGVGVGHRDEQAAVDTEAAEAAGCAVHAEAGVIEVASDLILDLEMVGEVGAWLNGAVGAGYAVLPGVLPLLDSGPVEKEGLVEVVEDIDDDVVVAGGIDVGSREFPVDENNLLGYTRRS